MIHFKSLVAIAVGLAAAAANAAPPAAEKPAAVAVTPVKGMNYDCTKAGNKTKAACKNVTQGGVATPAKPATAPMAPVAPVAASAPKAMNYDCTKAGNANKAVCKNVVVPPVAAPKAAVAVPVAKAATATKPMAATKPGTVQATLKNGKVVNYDCNLAGNKVKTACKK